MYTQTENTDIAEEHPAGDTGQIIFVLLFFMVWIADSFLLKYTLFVDNLISTWLQVSIGLLVTGLGFALLRTHTNGYIRLGKLVVTEGPYRLIRHPIYMSVLLILLGLSISTLSLASFLIWLLFFIFYNFIAAYEEKLLVAKFGQEYLDYMKRVPRWLPISLLLR